MGFKGKQNPARAVPFICIIITERFAWFHGERPQHIAKDVTRTLIKTYHWASGIRWFGILL